MIEICKNVELNEKYFVKYDLVKLIQTQIKLIYLLFCFHHNLDLSLMKAYIQKLVRNAFGIIEELLHFHNSQAKEDYA